MDHLDSWIAMTRDISAMALVSEFKVLFGKGCYAFMSCSDDGGRYAYDRQPSMCRWNLKKLSEALSTCLPEDKAEEMLKL